MGCLLGYNIINICQYYIILIIKLMKNGNQERRYKYDYI